MLACVVMYIMLMTLMPMFIKTLTLPLKYMFPILLVLCALGSFTLNNRVFDIWVLFGIGLLGYVLVNNGIPLSPTVLGYVLSKIIESNYRTALIGARGDFGEILTRPIALVLLLFTVVMVALPVINKKHKETATAK